MPDDDWSRRGIPASHNRASQGLADNAGLVMDMSPEDVVDLALSY